MIGVVARDSIAFDENVATLATDKRYGCSKCDGLLFEKKTAQKGPSLEKHIQDTHQEENLKDLEIAGDPSFRLRRKDKERSGERPKKMNYEDEMELLKIGNPYRLNPLDTSVPEAVLEAEEQIPSIYPQL